MNWQGLPYYPINQFYKSFFNQKVYKIPVSLSESCPNREGIRGMKTCIFCDEWGSAAYPENQKEDLEVQIEKNKSTVGKRSKAKKFLVYFQAYTNSFMKVNHLREAFKKALKQKSVCGLVVGTRPDCLSKAVLDLWYEFSQKTALFVELGVQSFDDKQLKWMERGHDTKTSLRAISRIRKVCPEVNLGVHLIFGLPNETELQVKKTAHLCSELVLDNVKLHNLHVLKNTPLAHLFYRGEFVPLSFEKYARKVMIFLQYLSADIPVHRLVAGAHNNEQLIAPQWVGYKMKSYQSMVDYLHIHKAYQGQKSFFSQKELS